MPTRTCNANVYAPDDTNPARIIACHGTARHDGLHWHTDEDHTTHQWTDAYGGARPHHDSPVAPEGNQP